MNAVGEVDEAHVLERSPEEHPGGAYLGLDQIGDIEVAPERGLQPVGHGRTGHQLHVHSHARMGLLERVGGLETGIIVVLGKDPESEGGGLLAYGVGKQPDAGYHGGCQYTQGGFTIREIAHGSSWELHRDPRQILLPRMP